MEPDRSNAPPPQPQAPAANAPKGSFLDRLRAQSEAIQEHQQNERQPTLDAAVQINGQLGRLAKWFEEALAHLDVIRPQVAHVFHVTDGVRVDRPRYDQGFVSSRRHMWNGRDLIEQIEVFYRLASINPIVLRVQHGASAAIEDQLRFAQLKFRYQLEKDDGRGVRHGVFTIDAVVPASVRFLPDYDRQTVEVSLRNVDRFETLNLSFSGATLDEAALEDLVRLMLGESSAFVRRAQLRGVGAALRPAGS